MRAQFNSWTAEFERYTLINQEGRKIPISHSEGEVLRLFLNSQKRLTSRNQMLDALRGAAGESFDRAIDVRISSLMTKLNEDSRQSALD